MEALLVFLAILTILVCYAISRNRKHGPIGRKWLPGPLSLPFLGSVIQIGYLSRKFQHFKVFEELCKRHGSVIGVQAGLQYMVIVEDYDTAKSILYSEAWADRLPPQNHICKISTGRKNFGLMFSRGEMWRENRKFVLAKLRESGFSEKNAMEVHLSEELKHFFKSFDRLRAQHNNHVPMNNCFRLTALNIVWRALCGARLSESDPEVQAFLAQLEEVIKGVKIGTQPDFAFPFLAGVPGLSSAGVTERHYVKITAYFEEIMKTRRAAGTYQSSQNNFMDAYLKKIEEAKDGPDSQVYCDKQLVLTCIDMFNAGSDTTGAALEFGILYMLAFPKVQRKVQAEIDRVTLENRTQVIMISDRVKMPYTEAVILESLRYGSVIPVIPRSNSFDTSLNGCYVPKDTLLMVNCYKLNHDPKVWGDPEEFRPERFLDQNGQVIKDNTNKLLAFGTGKRLCTGITSARASLFKIFTAVLQRYTLGPSPNHPLGPIGDFDTGINNKPKPFHCFAKLRKEVEN